MKQNSVHIIKKNAKKFVLLTIICFLFVANKANAQCGVSSNQWCLLGNAGTTAGTNYVGTFDLEPLVFKTVNTEWMRISTTGNVGIFTTTPAYKLDVAGDINLTGALRTGTFAGTAGQVLTSTGGGANIWTTPGNGTVTSVIGIAPIISSGGTAPDISIAQAGISADGFLSSADWNIFNNKISGTGTLNYLARWTSATTLGIGATYDDGTNVGIGTTTTPKAKLEVINGNVLFDGNLDNNPPVNGPGTRMMWIPSKAAFRSGLVTGTTWDYANIGTASTAFGYNTQANGDYSSAFGYGSIAQSYNSYVIGQYNIVSGTPGLWVATEPLFVIGNGGAYNNGPKAGGIIRNNALTVLKNGNVGITTITPKNKLDVQGGIAIGNSYAGIKVAPANGAIIRGKVGIGTATPKQTLDVNGRINVTNGVIQKGGSAITNTSDLGLYSLDPNTWMRFVTNGQPMRFYSDGGIGTNLNMIIAANGNVGIGTDLTDPSSASYKLAVKGKIRANKVVVDIGWADFVFEKNYTLIPLAEVEQYIKQNGRLPQMPSTKEVETNGGDLGDLVQLQMQKIEELTLYVIEQNKKIEQIQKELKIINNPEAEPRGIMLPE